MSDIEISEGVSDGAMAYEPSTVLDDEGKRYLSAFLSAEVKDVLDGSEREQFLQRVQKWRRMRIAEPEQTSKAYPWQNASNLVTPIMAQKTNVIYAKLVAMFSTKRPFWACETDDAELQKVANAISKLMNYMAKGPFHLNLEAINRTIFYDLVSLGTQVVRVPWIREEWATKTAEGAASRRVVHNGPSVVPVRLEDFLCRTIYDDVQKAPWVGFRSWLTYAELKQREAMGIYEDVDQVEAFYATEVEDSRRDELIRRGFSAEALGGDYDELKLYPIIEAYVSYDADGDGVPEDIKVWFEAESGVILRSEANLLGIRDVVLLRYFRIPGQLYGLGVGHFVEKLQEEADFLHNHRIDNLHFSLLPMFKRRMGSSALKKEELHPGIILDLDDVNDLQVLATPDLTGSTYQAEMLVRDYADRVTGANDPMSGYADPTMKSGADVGSTMFLAQQGNSILNAVYDGIENDYNAIGQLVLMQLVANKEQVDLSNLNPEDAALVQMALALPLESMPTVFKFRMETVDIARSDETKQQQLAMAAGMYTQYGQQMLQLTQMMQQPQLMQEVAARLYVGATRFMEQALEHLKVEDVKMLLPNTEQLEQALEAQSARNGSNAGGGPEAGMAGNAAGMAGMGAPAAGAGAVGP